MINYGRNLILQSKVLGGSLLHESEFFLINLTKPHICWYTPMIWRKNSFRLKDSENVVGYFVYFDK